MIIAITGATGFIGSELVDYHAQLGHEVRVLSRKASLNFPSRHIGVFNGDLTVSDSIPRDFLDNVDVLYHCAAEIKNENLMHEVNVLGTEKLIRAASGKVKRWVQLSSVGSYGNYREGIVDEASAEDPIGLYEVTKTLADNLVRDAFNKNAFEAVILRPSIVYGNTMSNQSLFQLISMINKGRFFYIGKADSSANYVHISDVVRALYACGTHLQASGQTYNVSNWCTVRELVVAIKEELGITKDILTLPVLPLKMIAYIMTFLPRFPLTSNRIDALTTKVRYSSRLIQEQLGFKLQVDNQAGMTNLTKAWKAKQLK